MDQEQRAKNVAIAQDVIKHLNALHVQPGTYLKIPTDFEKSVDFEAVAEVCLVCAKGAMVLSMFRLGNIPVTNEGLWYDLNFADMETIWDGNSSNADSIERAFEGWGAAGGLYASTHPGSKERLRAIMENVIENNGEFVWPDECLEAAAADPESDDADEDYSENYYEDDED